MGHITEEQSRKASLALAGVAQWIEHWPMNPKVPGLIPSQGTCLGCGPGPQLRACGRHLIDKSLRIDVSLLVSLLLFPSL